MDIMPRKPFNKGILPFRSEMERMFRSLMDESSLGKFFSDDEWTPAINVSEAKDSLVVKAELPGVDAKDIQVSISGDMLTIKGEKKQEEEEKDEQHYCCERYYGEFQRTIQLPAGIKTDEIKAKFDKGVLHITLPKVAEAQKKDIKIDVS